MIAVSASGVHKGDPELNSALVDKTRGYALSRLPAREGSAPSIDHVLRPSERSGDVISYLAANPVQSGLVEDYHDWPWTAFNLG